MAASSVEVDLLGEPRLKNGLTYYPGVEDPNGRALLFWCRRGRGAMTLLC